MRETKKITTPISKQVVEIYTYVTGREKRSLVNVFLDGKLSFNTDNQQINNMTSSMIDNAQNLAWKTIVVSIDGKKEGEISIIDTILDMRGEDYNFIVEAVNEVTKDKNFEEKKTD